MCMPTGYDAAQITARPPNVTRPSIGAQLVGHELVGRIALLFEQLTHEPQGS